MVSYKPIADKPKYRVGDDGSVQSLRRGVWVALKPSGKYPQVHLGKGNPRYVHHLVLEAFHGPCPPGLECCHEDGNRFNNRAANLRWDTHASNIADKRMHGTAQFGETHPGARLTEALVRHLRVRHRAGGCTYTSLGRELGLGWCTIRDAVLGITWAHVA